MKSKISALIDDELGAHEVDGIVAALRSDPDAIDAWRTYHLVGDALRNAHPLSQGFSERFSRRLAGEPIVVAPRRLERNRVRKGWMALSAAASVAAVALVGWVAFAPGPDGGGLNANRSTLARTEGPAVAKAEPVLQPVVAQAAKHSPSRPLPGFARDYLLAHQTYSPRVTVQGITPNVQTVSDVGAGRNGR